MSAIALEQFLARLYTDAGLRRSFLDNRERVARAAGLDADEVAGLLCLDAQDLELAAASFADKRGRASRQPPRRWLSWFRRTK